jgi:hypothetical protein
LGFIDRVSIPQNRVAAKSKLPVNQVAQVLTEIQMDVRLTRLIQELAQTLPVDGLGDAELQAEINAARQAPPE